MSSGVVASHNNSSGAALTTMEAAERARAGCKWLTNSSATMGTVEKALTDWEVAVELPACSVDDRRGLELSDGGREKKSD